jgi:hypothetical protein
MYVHIYIYMYTHTHTHTHTHIPHNTETMVGQKNIKKLGKAVNSACHRYDSPALHTTPTTTFSYIAFHEGLSEELKFVENP